MKLRGEKGGETMWVFKTTCCLNHPPEPSVFVLNGLVQKQTHLETTQNKTKQKDQNQLA